MLLGTAGIVGRQPWLLGGAGLAAALTFLVAYFGRVFERRRADIAATRSDLRGEAHALSDAVRDARHT